MVFGSLGKRVSVSSEREGVSVSRRECVNGDGKAAKYRVAREESGGEVLQYCFSCAIPLVKQGFTVEELTPKKEAEGQQSKSLVVERLRRIREERGQFGKALEEQMTIIDSYYDDLVAKIELMRVADRQALQRIKS